MFGPKNNVYSCLLVKLVLIGYIINKKPPPFAAYLLIKKVNRADTFRKKEEWVWKGNGLWGKANTLAAPVTSSLTYAETDTLWAGLWPSQKCITYLEYSSALSVIHHINTQASPVCIFIISIQHTKSLSYTISSCLQCLKPLWIKCKFH